MIDVAGVQRMLANLDPVGVAAEAARLRNAATGIRETGENINHTWTHALHPGVYEAPEGDLLRRAARPVEENTAEFAWGVWRVAGALETFAEEIGPIKTRLESLLVDAHAFVLGAGDDWREDEDEVAENNRLVAAVRDQAVALAAAEERCAAAIYAAYGGHEPAPVRTGGQPSAPPWGTAEEADLPWYEDIWNGVQSFGGGLWEVTWGGLSTLVFLQGADAAAEAWKGIGKWAASSAIVAIPGAQGLLVLDPVRDMVWNTHKGMVQGFLAMDEWKDDPARAGGMVTGNVLMLLGVKKAPTIARGTGNAARTANTGLRAAAAAGRALDPLTQLTYAGAKTGQLLKALKEQGLQLPRMPQLGPQPAFAGAPGNTLPEGPDLAAKTKDLATRAKNWLTLAEGPKDPDNLSTPSPESPGTSGRKGPGAAEDAVGAQRGAPPNVMVDGRRHSMLQNLGVPADESHNILSRAERRGLNVHMDELIKKANSGRMSAGEVAVALRDLEYSMNSGKLHPDSFAQQLAQLNVDGSLKKKEFIDKFRQSHAEIQAVRQVIETVDLAPGTHVVTHARGGRVFDDLGDGTRLSISPVSQADLLYKTADGIVHLEEVKYSPRALRAKIEAHPAQYQAMVDWRTRNAGDHAVRFRVQSLYKWTDLVRGSPSTATILSEAKIALVIDGRIFQPNELQAFENNINRKWSSWAADNRGARPNQYFQDLDKMSIEEAITYVQK